VHISQIAKERVEKVSDYLTEGQEVRVIVLDVERGRIKLSMKEVPEEAAQEESESSETQSESSSEEIASEAPAVSDTGPEVAEAEASDSASIQAESEAATEVEPVEEVAPETESDDTRQS
jgi:predicted RNA-binding protein with RPS1 domain